MSAAPKSKRARRMWLATRENGRMLSFSTTKANNDYLDPLPVFVLPADPESVEGYVEKMARAILTHQDYKPFLPIDATDRKMAHDIARAALQALLGRGKG